MHGDTQSTSPAVRSRLPRISGWIALAACVVLLVLHFCVQVRAEKAVLLQGGRADWQYGCVRYVYGIDELTSGEVESLVTYLRPLWALKSLSISIRPSQSNATRPLRQLTTVEWIYLEGASVRDDDLENIGAMKNLTYVGLTNTCVTKDGVEKLRLELPRLHRLIWRDRPDAKVSCDD